MSTLAQMDPPVPSDEHLLERYRAAGDSDAFAELVHRYERELFGYLRRFLHDAELAADVFQATFLRVHLKAATFKAGSRFKPWLYAIATNQAIDAQRRSRRHRMASLDRRRGDEESSRPHADLVPSAAASPECSVETAEERDWLRSAVAALSSAQREVLKLVYQDRIKYAEAARRLGVPLGTVKSRVHGAITRLGRLAPAVVPASRGAARRFAR